ncbi:hypothetical protein ACHQM5_009250 [Ranunculus cassubicifolius]
MAIHFLILLFLISAPKAYTQVPDLMADPDSECGPRLVSLIPCAPFVQGSTTSPGAICCNGLIEIVAEQPSCLCILLDPAFLSFPINQTLAMQLPILCNIVVNPGICSGPPPLMTPESPRFPMPGNPSAPGSPLITPGLPQLPTPSSPPALISPGLPQLPTPSSPPGLITPGLPQLPIPSSPPEGSNLLTPGSPQLPILSSPPTPESPQPPILKEPEMNSSSITSPVAALPPLSFLGFGASRSDSAGLKTGDVVAIITASFLGGVMNLL